MELHGSQLGIETENRHFSQCVDFLVPFDVLSNALHRTGLPCLLPAGHRNIKPSLLSREGFQRREIVRPED
jgi:hypothetical protein